MNRYLKMGLFGFFIWLIPFVVSVLIFPLRAMQRPLFESIMPVVIAIWTVFDLHPGSLKNVPLDYATDIG